MGRWRASRGPRRPRHHRQPRLSGDGGAAMVEAALVSPIFVLEFGVAYRDVLTVGDATTDAARVGAIQGPDVTPEGETADYSIVNAVRDGLAGLKPSNIEAIVVFKAGDATVGSAISQVPAACKTGPTSTALECNSYRPTDAYVAVQDGDVDYFKCLSTGDPACGWNPITRVDGPRTVDVEFLGVYIRYKHTYITGFFGSTFSIERASIMRLEPGDLNG